MAYQDPVPDDSAALAAQLGVDDPELAAAIEASYKTHVPPAPGAFQGAPGGAGVIDVEDEDRDLKRALELSRMEAQQRGLGIDDEDAVVIGGAPGSSSAAGAAGGASSISMPPPSASFLRPPTAPDEVGSNAAVDGGSSRGSSREGLEQELDPQLAAAVEASYAAQTEVARAHEEEDMLRQAMEMSRQEEERRQHQALRAQQDAELQESILMDQMREQEEKRRRVAEEEERRAQEEERRALEARQQEEERLRLEAAEAKRRNVPEEPANDAPNKVDLQIRVPDGRRARRRFLNSHTLGQVYDYLHVEGFLNDGEVFQLVSTMPRKEYKDPNQTLEDAGLQGQCALMLERTTS